MTFADLATQQPLGPLGHFDPVTGVGSVIVPNLAPGNYPVVATCVRPTLDVDMLEAGIRKNGAFLAVDRRASRHQLPGVCRSSSKTTLGPKRGRLRVPQCDRTDPHPEHRDAGCARRAVLHHPAPGRPLPVLPARTTRRSAACRSRSTTNSARSVTVRKASDLCAPADKNGEDPERRDSRAFLIVQDHAPRALPARVPGRSAVNQFGTVTVDVMTPKVLLVPTAFSDSGPPSSPAGLRESLHVLRRPGHQRHDAPRRRDGHGADHARDRSRSSRRSRTGSACRRARTARPVSAEPPREPAVLQGEGQGRP